MVHIAATTAVEAPDGSVRLERRVGSASLYMCIAITISVSVSPS